MNIIRIKNRRETFREESFLSDLFYEERSDVCYSFLSMFLISVSRSLSISKSFM